MTQPQAGDETAEGFVAASSIDDVRRLVRQARAQSRRIGCVPTMGALHAGHVSLFEVCRRHADFIVATIFVNPTQFGPQEDFQRYPRPLADDLRAAQAAGVDLVFTPDAETIYPEGFDTFVEVGGLSSVLEGEIRPGHFRGVATVVLKLFQIVQPDVAVFGAKDYQQQAVLRQMTRDLNLPVEIVTALTIREPDGLAMSSRNAYLSPKERKSALVLSESLALAAARLANGDFDLGAIATAMREHLASGAGVQPEYALIVDPDTLEPLSAPQPRMTALVAARLGTTRLIDNREIVLDEPS
ncbi:MAG: pantoate--beta-alanine ligase [Planctomyces sp.]|nr:pantoate--beta-alanine ligase [Planctomyces sp.]